MFVSCLGRQDGEQRERSGWRVERVLHETTEFSRNVTKIIKLQNRGKWRNQQTTITDSFTVVDERQLHSESSCCACFVPSCSQPLHLDVH
jgi:hypothetical protein